jgi:long-chain acyl-CoA synthetase
MTPVAETAAPPALGRLGEERLARLGDHPALVFEGVVHGAAALEERARRAGGGLVELGVQPGDRVVVLMANCPEVLITYQAVWRAGAVVTPVVFLVRGAELRHILADADATVAVTTSELAGGVLEAAAGAPALRTVVVAGAKPPAPQGVRIVTFDALEEAPPRPPIDCGGDALAALLYTGGTTGRAKGVALSHRALAWTGQHTQEMAHVPGVTRTLTPLPLSHAYGMLVSIAGMFEAEPGLAVIQRWFDPEEWLRLAVEHRVQRTSLVPAMIQMLLAQPLERADLSALRFVGCGAAPLNREAMQEFERRVPGCEIDEGYGLTESGAIISANPPGRRRAGSVGMPLPGCALRIVDDDDREQPPGTDGEICARSPGIMAGYWRAEEETATALRGGWLHTGDIGHLDSDGYLYVVDRKKDLILRGGFNVFPRDVEDALLSHPGVAMAGAVGRPDARLGEEVVAFVTLVPGATATPEELVGYARTVLAPTKYPREVRIVDRMPLTSVGKLDRKALRARLGA